MDYDLRIQKIDLGLHIIPRNDGLRSDALDYGTWTKARWVAEDIVIDGKHNELSLLHEKIKLTLIVSELRLRLIFTILG